MVNIVKTGLSLPSSTLPGPIKLKTKAGDVYKRAMDDEYEKQLDRLTVRLSNRQTVPGKAATMLRVAPQNQAGFWFPLRCGV